MSKNILLKTTLSQWPKDGLEHLGYCPVCHSQHRQLTYEHVTDNTFLCAPGEWTLWQCENCNSNYLDPRPSQSTIGLAYKNYYTHTHPTSSPLPIKKNWGKLLFQAMSNAYENHRFGTQLSPSFPYSIKLFTFLFPQRKRNIDNKYRFLPDIGSGKKILDIGCGSGDFLARVKNIGWNTVGVDFDEKAIEHCKKNGLNVYLGGVDSLMDQANSFDAITISHVIEHVHNPVKMVRQAYSLLKPGGFLYIETPNGQSMGRKLYHKAWRGIEAPRHLSLLNWESLYMLLRQSNFINIDKIYKPEVSKNMFRLSKSIQNGTFGDNSPPTKLTILENLAKFSVNLLGNKSEFVTMTARKSLK